MDVHPHLALLAGRGSLGASREFTIGRYCPLMHPPVPRTVRTNACTLAGLVLALARGGRCPLARKYCAHSAARNSCGQAVRRDGDTPLFLGILAFSYALQLRPTPGRPRHV